MIREMRGESSMESGTHIPRCACSADSPAASTGSGLLSSASGLDCPGSDRHLGCLRSRPPTVQRHQHFAAPAQNSTGSVCLPAGDHLGGPLPPGLYPCIRDGSTRRKGCNGLAFPITPRVFGGSRRPDAPAETGAHRIHSRTRTSSRSAALPRVLVRHGTVATARSQGSDPLPRMRENLWSRTQVTICPPMPSADSDIHHERSF